MSTNRLVKVALPSKLVTQMDDYVTKAAAYAGRTEFVTDAVANLLADLQALIENGSTEQLQDPRVLTPVLAPSDSTVKTGGNSKPQDPLRKRIPLDDALDIATIREPSESAPTLSLDLSAHEPSSEPTWGMHNRDWPTIWAASMLGRLTASGPIEYSKFKDELVDAAWAIGSVFKREWDLSGFPGNESKADRSEARFIEFFVGSQLGRGPLFSFGMALPKGSSEVALTTGGAELLGQLSGMTREKSQAVSSSWRLAFLRHLSRFAPADVEMLQEIVAHISNGDSTRVELIAAIGQQHPEWPGGTAGTNAAGYVARAREWGILDPKQANHRYVIEKNGADDLSAARVSVAEEGGTL